VAVIASVSLRLVACGSGAEPTSATNDDAGPVDGATDDGATPSDSGRLPSVGDPAGFCTGLLGWFSDRNKCCMGADLASTTVQGYIALSADYLSYCNALLASGVASGRIRYDGDAAMRCLAGFDTTALSACGSAWNLTSTAVPNGTLEPSPACKDVVTGYQTAGQPCAANHECIDGLWCKGQINRAEGTCAPPAQVDELCTRDYERTDGAIKIDLASFIKWPFGAHPTCAPGLACPDSPGKCVAEKADGANCAKAEQCAVGRYCHLGTCGAAPPGALNAPCINRIDCAAGLYCKKVDASATGVCAALETANGPCSSSARDACRGICVIGDGGATQMGPGTCASFCQSG
jgi:hypothetical protein